jgi:hypothetical protein
MTITLQRYLHAVCRYVDHYTGTEPLEAAIRAVVIHFLRAFRTGTLVWLGLLVGMNVLYGVDFGPLDTPKTAPSFEAGLTMMVLLSSQMALLFYRPV